MNRTPEQWAQVVPRAFLPGSIAQASNVIEMAVQDIGHMATRVKELEAERDARPVVSWINTDSWPGRETLYFGHVAAGFIVPYGGTWEAHPPHTEFHPTIEAAKAAVEAALRGSP